MRTLFFILFITISLSLHGQIPDSLGAFTRPSGAYFLSYFRDTYSFMTLPLRWNDRDWAAMATGLTTGAMVMGQDDIWFDGLQKAKSPFTEDMSRYFLEPLGSGMITVPALALLYGYGAWKDSDKARQTSLMGIKAFVLAAGFSGGAKMLFHRSRPTEHNDPWHFGGPGFETNHLSLPSGHTTAVFSVATIVAYQYREKPWIGITAYTLATLAGLSRIHDGKHWPSDVFFGAMLGYTLGRCIVSAENTQIRRIAIHPLLSPGCSGFSLAWNLK